MANWEGPYEGKRALDLLILALLLPGAALLGVLCAMVVALSSRGPVFFRQERIGLNGKPFKVWKFRTMTHGDNPLIPDASRITAVGRYLRRTSLDELPQLINVALGQMSIVGPRPTLGYQVERYDDFQRRRLAVRPGLTGLAQISGRNALTWNDRIRFDVAYVESQSGLEDLRILWRTIAVIATGEGVDGHPVNDPIVVLGDPPIDLTDAPHGAAEVAVDLTEPATVDLTESIDLTDLPAPGFAQGSLDLLGSRPAVSAGE